MTGSRSLLIRADRILTLDGQGADGGVIADAALLVHGGTIAAVGPASEIHAPYAETMDLRGLTLLPGLINAHCHLDYTCLRDRLPASAHFAKWLLGIVVAKGRLRRSDYEASVRAGLDELLRYGTTTVFEVSCDAGRYAITRVADATPIRIAFFAEAIGVTPLDAWRRFRRTRRALAEFEGDNVIASGLAPHAVYSTTKGLLKAIRLEAVRREAVGRFLPVTIHLLESRDEPRLGLSGNPRRAVKILDKCRLFDAPVLGVHVNYPDDEDVAILAARGAYVVHCPGSHRFFGHDPFPAERLREAGVPICLGTDSLASNERLDMLREMRLFLDAHTAFTAEDGLRMATTVPARFLGLDGRLGLLKPGALADAIAVPTPQPTTGACSTAEACARVVAHDGEVPWVMIGGSVVRCP
jgi:cytosine/adenosine deaminase-related metal-dependent hydrolase